MLVMWDRGFPSFEMIMATVERGAAFLGRLPARVHPQIVRRLSDGSSLVYLMPSDYHERQAGARIPVRLVEDTITYPHLKGDGQRHRLITSLLDSAIEIASASHERWEIELVIDARRDAPAPGRATSTQFAARWGHSRTLWTVARP